MNYRIPILSTIFFLFTTVIFAQESNLEFSGYLEDTLTGERNKVLDKTFIINETRVRLNIANRYKNKGDFSVAIVGTHYTGKKSYNLLDYLPEDDAAEFSSPVLIEQENDIWFQEAYGSLYLGNFSFRIGRQKYYTGTGYAWNPTDLFNWKNVLDPTYEIEGIDSIYLAQSFFEQASISVFYSFGTSKNTPTREYIALEDGDVQVKLKMHIFSWDAALFYSNVIKDYYDYEGVLSGAIDPVNLVDRARWQISGMELSGELFGIGIHAEGGYIELSKYDSEDDLPEMLKDHKKYLIGIDYTFESGLYLIFEYYHEGLGESRSDDYSINQRMAYLSGYLDSMGEDNYFVGISYPVSDFTTLALYTIGNQSDSSVVINPWITWIAGDDITVNFSIQIPSGEEESAIGRSEPSAFGRVKFTF